MKLYRHWVAETREIAGTTFHLRDGSNVSPEDAAAKLERRAAILRASEGRDLSEKESAAVREALLDLGGRTPEGEYEAAICEDASVGKTRVGCSHHQPQRKRKENERKCHPRHVKWQ